MIKSLDPRITRAEIEENNPIEPLKEMDQWETFEVFHQKKRGDQHMHVGIVHAPNAEMALLYAKEQYGRRGISVNIWVVRTANVYSSEYEDADMFDVAEKLYREAGGYKVMEKINKYKKEHKTG
ncbi:MAG: 1,2-phenylacetyl-CoA epoxidase subunit B [Bacteroidia bacterium]